METIDKLLEMIPKSLGYDTNSVTIFENNMELNSESAINNFRNFLVDNKIKHNTIGGLAELSNSYLIQTVKNTLDGYIVFESTGITQRFKDMIQIVTTLSKQGYRFKVIECVMQYASINFIPDEASDDLELYSVYCFDEDISKWKLEQRFKK